MILKVMQISDLFYPYLYVFIVQHMQTSKEKEMEILQSRALISTSFGPSRPVKP